MQVSWLPSEGFFLPPRSFFYHICCSSWWVRNSPDPGSLHSRRSPAPPWSLTAGKAFLEGKPREAWDSRLQPAPSLLLASCWRGCPLGASTSPAQQADSACAYGRPAARRARGRQWFPAAYEPGLLPEVAAAAAQPLPAGAAPTWAEQDLRVRTLPQLKSECSSAGPPSLLFLRPAHHRSCGAVASTIAEGNPHVSPEPEQLESVLLRDQLNPHIILML